MWLIGICDLPQDSQYMLYSSPYYGSRSWVIIFGSWAINYLAWALFSNRWSIFDHYDPDLYFIAHDLKFMEYKPRFYRSLSKILWIVMWNLWIMSQNILDHNPKFAQPASMGNLLWFECFDSNSYTKYFHYQKRKSSVYAMQLSP